MLLVLFVLNVSNALVSRRVAVARICYFCIHYMADTGRSLLSELQLSGFTLNSY